MDDLDDAESALDEYKFASYLAQITDRSLPPSNDDLTSLTDSVAQYRSRIFSVPVYDSTRAVQATIVGKRITKKDTVAITYPIYPSMRVGTFSRFGISVGIAVTPGLSYQKTATAAGGQVTVTNNVNNVSFMVGLHVYPWRYLPLDNSFLGISKGNFRHRVSIFTGVGLPNPLQNFYGGCSFDLLPGFKVITGPNFSMNTRYQLLNGQIASQANGVKYGGFFVSVNIDPSAFLTVLGLFK